MPSQHAPRLGDSVGVAIATLRTIDSTNSDNGSDVMFILYI
jgi:hypothetical protein